MTALRPGAGSLRVNLMLWLIVPVVAILGVSLWLSFASAMRQATLIMNRQILSSARMIAEQTRFRDAAIRVTVPPAALELFASDSHDEVCLCRVRPQRPPDRRLSRPEPARSPAGRIRLAHPADPVSHRGHEQPSCCRRR